jgi:ParB-like chromosome segregation protein Spo0J
LARKKESNGAPTHKEPAPWPADKVERRSVASLVPAARNPRTHSPEQVDQLAASIREWGWTVPVLVDEQGGLLAGHGRVLAAKKLGLAEIPVMVAAGWSEAQKRAYVIADNKLTLNGGWDDELLKVELDDLKALDFDLALMGFSLDEIGALSGDAPAPGGDGIETPGAGAYKEQYGVIVVCSSETDQAEIYERLKGEGLTVKVVTT